ncbi:type VI secretion system-associated FHA domain protein TagH [Rhabdaerophilum calidifontis]|uniref:type VI secretion system-associated FHA domain protein TagH n=1 Tax=Rhabdaerophilum calidifontis TaxID=2604328 RepID=UPI001239DB31|nr:type VI secretion system-associated FHA domain protein TagH [Rhabdaerophilum calidifontis]
MSLLLKIENIGALPDGGPLSYVLTGRRGIDIGRDAHLDWVLPDPSRVISGRHCEIRYRDGGYWLHDVSANGTYLNGDANRLAAPRRLRTGDRLEIGHYIIAVSVTGEAAEAALPVEGDASPPAPASADLWSVGEEAAPPAPVPRERSYRPVHADDFIDRASDIPAPAPDWRGADPWSGAGDSGAAGVPAFERPRPRHQEPRPEAAPLPVAEPVPAPVPDFTSAALPVLPVPEPVESLSPPAADAAEFIRRFEIGAGLPPGALKEREPGALAEELGRMMLAATAELKALMQARSESKSAMRSASHTTVQALDNNPIPFAPTAEDALRIMLGPRGKSYLAGEAALRKTFEALKTHQLDTFVAMQAALDGLIKELDPAEIEATIEPEGKVGALFASRRARLWDLYRSRWQALAASHPDGIRGVFLNLFTARYDRTPPGR